MITRIEIDGFKTFRMFSADLKPFVAVVGPNATGKSNLFDALKFLSRLAQVDVRQAMQELRGEPEELFRQTPSGNETIMAFAIEVLLPARGVDDFGASFETPAQRLRYEISIEMREDPHGIFVTHEDCRVIRAEDDKMVFKTPEKISRSGRKTPFLETEKDTQGRSRVFTIRQDGVAESGTSKRGNPLQLPAAEASRSALSTIATSEFRHLYALKKLIAGPQFLEINPSEARRANDRFEDKRLRSNASNLAASLSEIQRLSATENRPTGAIADISADLALLIPQVRSVRLLDDTKNREYAFEVQIRDGTSFSSRVISDGTIRLLALLAVVDDPNRQGILCFEEPENGVHEGRIPDLITLLREATEIQDEDGDYFQVLLNTHSPAVMRTLNPDEVLFADMVRSMSADGEDSQVRTRMRRIAPSKGLFDDEHHLYPEKVEEILRNKAGGI
ncbi:AAA family ATPase [Sphingomonas colocasiae]|uniref:AAA family ATPase n=1 Tax=Sphingomonas colocasiae TaxID=1848973 RepID=A0ABS7PKQ7_9SPHN|nr:AAA family ATPase [Sphingomonas colocasiae]MBY8821871.1 AAA family ATPase [Sphingomonas colocasiae]